MITGFRGIYGDKLVRRGNVAGYFRINKLEAYTFREIRWREAILWLILVEHSLGVRGVGSSNLPVPTITLVIAG